VGAAGAQQQAAEGAAESEQPGAGPPADGSGRPAEEEHQGEPCLLDHEQAADQAVRVEVEPQAGLGEQGGDGGSGEVNRDPGEPFGARGMRSRGTLVPQLRPVIGAPAGRRPGVRPLRPVSREAGHCRRAPRAEPSRAWFLARH